MLRAQYENWPQKQFDLHNTLPKLIEETLNAKLLQDTQNQINVKNQKLNSQQIKDKISALWKSGNNSKTEKDFIQTCLLYKKDPTPNPELIQAFQEYVKTYHKVTSLYHLCQTNKIELIVYGTESESEEVKISAYTELSDDLCIAQLPNGELFCFGNMASRNTFIIDNDYKIRILPSGVANCYDSSVIYFNKNVYSFGGSKHNRYLTLSSRFDLDEKRWIEPVPMPKADTWCTSVIFNRNILISGYCNQNILLYSIEINSFSEIPYVFYDNTKVQINSEDKLYLLGFDRVFAVYESDVEDEFAWKIIVKLARPSLTVGRYWRYNKGEIYIKCIEKKPKRSDNHYYKFRLNKKELIELRKKRLKFCDIF